WIGQPSNPTSLCPHTGLAQRHAEAAIGQCQPQQRLGVLDFSRPRESPTQPCRCFQVKTRRKARTHFRPVIQNLRTNLHPKLESYRDSWCPELKLAPMTPTLSPHPPSPEGWLRRTRVRGEGAKRRVPPYHLNSRISARGGWPNSSFTEAGSSCSMPSNSSEWTPRVTNRQSMPKPCAPARSVRTESPIASTRPSAALWPDRSA